MPFLDPAGSRPQGFVILPSIQQTFSGMNTDGSFTTAISNLFLSPLEKIP